MKQALEQDISRPIHCRQDRGNDQPVLNELRHALEQLIASGKQTIIDIKSLPFGPFDEQRLAEVLGQGEVEAVVHALGESRVTETAFSGIWWVEHRNDQGDVIAKFIEVTFLPEILRAQREDVAGAIKKLRTKLEGELCADRDVERD